MGALFPSGGDEVIKVMGCEEPCGEVVTTSSHMGDTLSRESGEELAERERLDYWMRTDASEINSLHSRGTTGWRLRPSSKRGFSGSFLAVEKMIYV